MHHKTAAHVSKEQFHVHIAAVILCCIRYTSYPYVPQTKLNE